MTGANRGTPPSERAESPRLPSDRELAAIARSRERLLDARIDLANGARRLQATVDRVLAVGRLRAGSVAKSEAEELGATLMAAISHDLRTPLTAVSGLAETLRVRGEHLDETMKGRMLDRITVCVADVIRILDQVLDLASSSGIQRRPTDLALLAASIADAVDDGGREITIEPGPASAHVDEVIVGRILRNLLSNAIVHTPPGTPIWVRFAEVAEGIELVVEDAGGGVAPRELPAEGIEVSPVRPGEQGHLGLGLLIVGRLARHHNGRAWMTARAGGGTSVYVILGR